MKKIISLFCINVFLLSSVIAQTTGTVLFNNLQVHVIEINFSQIGYWNTLMSNKVYDDANDSSTYIPATVTVDGNLLDSVGIQLKGNSSYYNYPTNKKPFTLSFNEYISGQQYDGLKSLNLNNGYQDPTMMREKLFLDFLNEKGLYAPRANYAKLYLNGTYWGLYLMVERVNKTFCNDRFGNNGGNLFKGDNGSSACAKLEYHGVMAPYYNCYDLKTNTTANDWTDLVNLTAQINNTTASQFYDSVNAVMNTNSFIGAWAACNLFSDFDSYSFRFQHNYYIYHNSSTDKFEWITWDVSTAFGTDIPQTVTQIEANSVLYLVTPVTDKPLSNRMLSDSLFKQNYLNTICDYANNNFLPAVLFPKIDSIRNIIDSAYYADPLKMYSNQNFDDNIDNTINLGYDILGLKTFITNRSANVLNELATLNVTCVNTGVNSVTPEENYFSVYPNPTNDILRMNFTGKYAFRKIRIINMLGESLKEENIFPENSPIDISSLSSGIYFIQLINQEGNITVTQKFIKE